MALPAGEDPPLGAPRGSVRSRWSGTTHKNVSKREADGKRMKKWNQELCRHELKLRGIDPDNCGIDWTKSEWKGPAVDAILDSDDIPLSQGRPEPLTRPTSPVDPNRKPKKDPAPDRDPQRDGNGKTGESGSSPPKDGESAGNSGKSVQGNKGLRIADSGAAGGNPDDPDDDDDGAGDDEDGYNPGPPGRPPVKPTGNPPGGRPPGKSSRKKEPNKNKEHVEKIGAIPCNSVWRRQYPRGLLVDQDPDPVSRFIPNWPLGTLPSEDDFLEWWSDPFRGICPAQETEVPLFVSNPRDLDGIQSFGRHGWQNGLLVEEMRHRHLDPYTRGPMSRDYMYYKIPRKFFLQPHGARVGYEHAINMTLCLLNYEIEGMVQRFGGWLLPILEQRIRDLREDCHGLDGGPTENTAANKYRAPQLNRTEDESFPTYAAEEFEEKDGFDHNVYGDESHVGKKGATTSSENVEQGNEVEANTKPDDNEAELEGDEEDDDEEDNSGNFASNFDLSTERRKEQCIRECNAEHLEYLPQRMAPFRTHRGHRPMPDSNGSLAHDYPGVEWPGFDELDDDEEWIADFGSTPRKGAFAFHKKGSNGKEYPLGCFSYDYETGEFTKEYLNRTQIDAIFTENVDWLPRSRWRTPTTTLNERVLYAIENRASPVMPEPVPEALVDVDDRDQNHDDVDEQEQDHDHVDDPEQDPDEVDEQEQEPDNNDDDDDQIVQQPPTAATEPHKRKRPREEEDLEDQELEGITKRKKTR